MRNLFPLYGRRRRGFSPEKMEKSGRLVQTVRRSDTGYLRDVRVRTLALSDGRTPDHREVRSTCVRTRIQRAGGEI
jgi:hypothetical protein